MPAIGRPAYKDSLYQLLKVALSFVPPAHDMALINPDEPDPGDMRGAYKDFLKFAMVVLPSTETLLDDPRPQPRTNGGEKRPPERRPPLLAQPSLLSPPASSAGPSEPRYKDGKRSRAPSIAILVEEDSEPPEPPKPVKIWQMILQRGKLISSMTPTVVLPPDEDVLYEFSRVDYYARRIFPTTFTIGITLYWYLYTYYITDEGPPRKEPSDGLIIV